ncbi:helicase [Bifidobacterium sp. MA2]|uniref:Helicase n=1 Tax=Bifidobacterium santillanense TaxID=2809028 RepID=A0ABS5URP0_9BIFI|nr:DUF4355 domain-containing protein [Bifidobacterium santillanense]MBT1173575.1 helicase [Bifidobacterium santillanense]
MFRHQWPRHIRLIDAPAGAGGSDVTTPPAGENAADEPIDYEAKYNEALKHSREWEKRAKANKQAADELEKLKEASMSEQEKAAKHVKELEDKVAKYEAAAQQSQWKAQVSAETGVPADVLEGDSLEAIQAHAKRINALLHPKPKAPAVHGVDRQPSGKGPNENMLGYLRSLGI